VARATRSSAASLADATVDGEAVADAVGDAELPPGVGEAVGFAGDFAGWSVDDGDANSGTGGVGTPHAAMRLHSTNARPRVTPITKEDEASLDLWRCGPR
jgi:hypothetical protein